LLLYDARGWYRDTVGLTNNLLNVLASAPSTPERAEQKIMLQTSLARALLAAKGYTEETEQAYVRALELCESAGEIPQLFPVLRGLTSLYTLRSEHEKALQMGERILHLADQLGDMDMKTEGLLITGYNLAFNEDIQSGLERVEAAIALYNSRQQHTRRLGVGSNSAVVGLAVSAFFLWMRGFPDRAHSNATESIVLAQQLNHPYSLTYAQFHHGLLNMWLRNPEIALRSAEGVLELAEAHGFQIWSAIGACLRAAALIDMGVTDEGLTLIEQGMNTYRGLKTPPVFWPFTASSLCWCIWRSVKTRGRPTPYERKPGSRIGVKVNRSSGDRVLDSHG
jgi:tetratricopeptide (TPR) repeat protein